MTLYFLKELLLLKKQSLSNSIRDILFQRIIDKIFIDGFSQNDESESTWAIIVIGKIADILDDDVISKGIYDRFFGKYDFSAQGLPKTIFSKKWIVYLKQAEGVSLLLPYSYILYLANLHGVFLELGEDIIQEHLTIFIQKAYSFNDIPTLVCMICFKMSSVLRRYVQDMTPITVT